MKHLIKSAVLASALVATGAMAHDDYQYPYEYRADWDHDYLAMPYTGMPQNYHARSMPHDMALEEKALLEALSGTGAHVIHEHSRLRIVMPVDAGFTTAKADVNSHLQAVLNGIAKVMMHYDFSVAEVGAHADSRGSVEYNMKLTEKRANAAKHYLESQGVPAARVIAVAHSELEPAASNKTQKGMQENRRIVVDLYSAKPRKF